MEVEVMTWMKDLEKSGGAYAIFKGAWFSI